MGMETPFNRLSNGTSFFSTILCLLGCFNWITANLDPAAFDGNARMHTVLELRSDRKPYRSELSNVIYEMQYDFGGFWDWNTHVMVNYLVVSYEAPGYPINTMTVFDRIHVSRTEQADVAPPGLFSGLVPNKYPLRHISNTGLKGQLVSMKLCSNKIPKFGFQSTRCVDVEGYRLPPAHVETRRRDLPQDVTDAIARPKPGK